MNNDISNMSYTNKDFQTIFPEILDYVKTITLKWDPSSSNESDPGVVILKVISLLADKLNYNIDKNILECFPGSVTQDRNAWALFSQLGYNMHWYNSSETDVSIVWVGDYSDERINIPRFAQICDAEMSTIFTLTHPVTFYSSANRNSVVGHVIEGSIAQVSVNGSTTITLDNLDSKNRIFLTDSNVAENGIFINNVGLENYSDWTKVDNLYIQPAYHKCYKVGVDVVSNLVYIQFPDAIVDMISNGIEIRYVRSQGYDGNIKPYLLTQFYESTIDGVDVSSDNVRIVNYSASTGGKDIETIDEAYKTFQKVCNICDTLVTCSDFKNYLLQSPIVSNCTVTDRNTDPALSYVIRCIDTDNTIYYDNLSVNDYIVSRLLPSGGGSIPVLNNSVSMLGTVNRAKVLDSQSEPSYSIFTMLLGILGNISLEEYGLLDPFSIRIIPLKPVDSDDNITADAFNKSFDILCNKRVVHRTPNYYIPNTIMSYLNGMKHIGITYSPLFTVPFELTNNTFDLYFQNQFDLDITFVPTYKLSEIEVAEVKSNILTALYRHFNAKEIDFGQEIKYDDIFTVLSNCDARIKTLIMSPFTYKLYGKTIDNFTEFMEEVSTGGGGGGIKKDNRSIGTRALDFNASPLLRYDLIDIPAVDLILPLTERYNGSGSYHNSGNYGASGAYDSEK